MEDTMSTSSSSSSSSTTTASSSSSSSSSYDKLTKNHNKCYNKSSCAGAGGFRLHSRKFSVHRLRTKFLSLFRLCRNSYRNTLRHLRIRLALRKILHHFRTITKTTPKNPNRHGYYFPPTTTATYSYSSAAAPPPTAVVPRSMTHSNSFCSEAIADCLEFIKRNSISLEDNDDTNPMLKLD